MLSFCSVFAQFLLSLCSVFAQIFSVLAQFFSVFTQFYLSLVSLLLRFSSQTFFLNFSDKVSHLMSTRVSYHDFLCSKKTSLIIQLCQMKWMSTDVCLKCPAQILICCNLELWSTQAKSTTFCKVNLCIFSVILLNFGPFSVFLLLIL